MNAIAPSLNVVAPAGVPKEMGEIIKSGDEDLYLRIWRPTSKPLAVLAFVPGFNSHGGHFSWAAERLAARGFAVYAIDLRGRGRSSGVRFHVDRFADYLDDVDNMIRIASRRDAGLEIFLMGHSAGGVIATAYAMGHQAQLAGLICESFAFRVPAPAPVLSLVKWISAVFPRLPVLKLPNAGFSRDRRFVRDMDRDPAIRGERSTAGAVTQMNYGNELIERGFESLTLPLLIMHGSADTVTLPNGSHRFFLEAGSQDKALKLYDGHMHDLLNDVGRDEPMDDIITWIRARV
jgi:acylglycerol lipase